MEYFLRIQPRGLTDKYINDLFYSVGLEEPVNFRERPIDEDLVNNVPPVLIDVEFCDIG